MSLVQNTTNEARTGRLKKTAGYYAAFLILGLSTAALGPTLPALAEQTRSTLGQVSILFSARALGYLLGSLLGGRLFDRLPGQRVMGFVLLGMAVGLACVPAIPLLWALAALLLALGTSEGALDVGANTLIVWVHQDRVGPFMNGLHALFGVGAFCSPLIFAQVVLLTGGIAGGYWMLALLVLPVALYNFVQASPPHQGRAEDGSHAPLNWRLLVPVMIFFFLMVGLEGAYGGWLYTYIRQLDLGTAAGAAYLTSAYWGAFTAGRLIGIPLSIRFRPGSLILADLLGCLLSMLVIVLWPSSTTALTAGTLGLGLSIASIFPNTLTFAGARMAITGRVTSLFFVGASLGSMFFPWFVGQLIEPLGPPSVMGVLAAASGLLLAVFAWMRAAAK
jgi:FHS family Na+ dependent glucose MFS transporter 1